MARGGMSTFRIQEGGARCYGGVWGKGEGNGVRRSKRLMIRDGCSW